MLHQRRHLSPLCRTLFVPRQKERRGLVERCRYPDQVLETESRSVNLTGKGRLRNACLVGQPLPGTPSQYQLNSTPDVEMKVTAKQDLRVRSFPILMSFHGRVHCVSGNITVWVTTTPNYSGHLTLVDGDRLLVQRKAAENRPKGGSTREGIG